MKHICYSIYILLHLRGRGLLTVVILLTGVAVEAQHNLSGNVLDLNNEPLTAVHLKLTGTAEREAQTDAQGRFIFMDLPNGNYELEGEKYGAFFMDDIRIDGKNYTKTYYMALQSEQESLGTVTVTGLKSAKSELERSGFAVTVVEMDKIAKQNVTTNELLDRVVGVRLRTNGGIGSRVNYALNGMSGNSVRIFIDGIPLSTYGSSFDLGSIPPSLIDHVEIYKGVVPSHLATDALGGAINVILKEGIVNNLSASTSYGSFNTVQTHINGMYREESTGLTAEVSAFQDYSDNDYKVWGRFVFDFTPEGRKKLTKARRFNDRYRAYGVRANLGFTDVSWADRFMIGYNGSKTHKEIQHGATMVTPYKGRYMEPRANVLLAEYRKKDILTKGLEVKANFSFAKRKQFVSDLNEFVHQWSGEIARGLKGEPLRTSGGAQQGAKTLYHADREIYSLRTGLRYEFIPNNSFSVNYLYNDTYRKERDDMRTKAQQEYFGTRGLQKNILAGGYEGLYFDERLKANLFVKSYHQTLKKMEPYALNNDHGIVTREEVREQSKKSVTGYGFATSYTFWDAFMATASAEKAVRMPVETEAFGSVGENIVENFNLKPEQSNNYNLGLKIGPYALYERHQASLFVGGFYRDTKDRIMRKAEEVFVESIQTAPFVNLGKTKSYGFEAELTYQYNRNLNVTFNLSQVKSLYNIRYDDNGNPVRHYNEQLPNEPTFNLNLGADYTVDNIFLKHSALQLHYNFGFVQNFYTIWQPGKGVVNREDILYEMEIPSQQIHDLGFSYTFPKRDFTLSVDFKNMFNAQVYDNFAVQKPGRAFYVKINYQINHF